MCNHVSYVDALIIAGCVRRPVRFVMYYKIFQLPLLRFDLAAAMEAAARNNPFETSVGKALHLFFTAEEPRSPDLAGLEALQTTTEEFLLKDGVFYLYAPDGIGRSKLAAQVEKKLGVPGTSRNWNTVSRLIALADELNEDG